jgi:hypothetical protein
MPINQQDVSMFASKREEMRFYASPAVAWFLPLASGLTIGSLLGAVVGLISLSFHYFLLTTSIVAIPVWFYLTWKTFGKLGLMPQRQVKVLKLVIIEEGGKKLTKKEFESVDDNEFIEICRHIIIHGGTFAIRSLKTLGMSENQVMAFRMEIVQSGMAFNDTNGEVKLKPSGRKYLEEYVAAYPIGGGDDA